MKKQLRLKNVDYPMIAFGLVIILSTCTLFIKPLIGMADNGDFFRVLIQSDLYHLVNNEQDKLLGYFNKDYGIFQYNNENAKTVESTQFILIKLAILVNNIFVKNNVFDIRFLAVFYVIAHATGIYLLVKVMINDISSNKYKMLITALFIFIFCDTGYIAYFNSFFGEAMNLSFFLLSIGILLNMYTFKKYTIFNLIAFFFASFMFVGSKQQLAPIGILVAIVIFRLFILKKEKCFKYTSWILGISMIVSSVYFYVSISGEFDYINRYHAMTRGVMLYESNSQELLKEFNIDSQYSVLQEEIFFDKIPVIDLNGETIKEEFYDKSHISSILQFYIKHPYKFLKMINFSVVNGYSIRPKVMGNYEKIEGKAFGEQSNFFALWSTIKEKYMPHNLFLTIMFFGIYFTFAAKRYIESSKSKNVSCKLFEESFVYVFLVGASQIFVSIIGAGDADLAKHVFMFNVTFDIILIYSIKLIIKNTYEKKNK